MKSNSNTVLVSELFIVKMSIGRKQQYETDYMKITEYMLFSLTVVTLRNRPAAMNLCKCIFLTNHSSLHDLIYVKKQAYLKTDKPNEKGNDSSVRDKGCSRICNML